MTKYRIVERKRKKRGGEIEIDYYIQNSNKILFITFWTNCYTTDSQGESEVEYYNGLVKAEFAKEEFEKRELKYYNSKITKVNKRVL